MGTDSKQKYLDRLDDLIQVGGSLPEQSKRVPTGGNYLSGETYYRTKSFVRRDQFVEWRTSCVTLLDGVLPDWSSHRSELERFKGLGNDPSSKEFGVAFLKAIRTDLEYGLLDDIESHIDAEINSEFLTQAESFLGKSSSTESYLAAAILAGAVLEHCLRRLCRSFDPPEPEQDSGKPRSLNNLIDALKRRRLYNEVTAKQLRSFAGIRNAAVHGQFDQFTADQARSMVQGVQDFLARHAP